MQYTFLKRRSFYIPFSIFLVLGVLCAVVFNPGFQKKQLLKRAGPAVESLEIGRVHVTPWSTEFDEVTVRYGGGRFHVDAGRIRYSLASLIFKKINVKRLSLQGVRADLSDFTPPEQTAPPATQTSPGEPFAGVLATLDAGFAYIVDEIEVNAQVTLPADRSVTVALNGGGIRPDTTGAVTFDTRFVTGTDDDHVDIDGSVSFDQLTAGRFSALETTLAIRAEIASLPQTEHLAVQLFVAPAVESNQTPDAEDDGKVGHTPETIELSLHQDDREGARRAALELTGLYDGNKGDFTGDYRLSANERLLQPYADPVLAPSSQTLAGSLALNVASLTGNMTVNSELQVTELQTTYGSDQLPQRLQMQNDFRVSVLAGRRLRIDRLETAVGHGADQRALTSKLAADQSLALDNVGAFLRQDNTLLSFDIPDVPLAWLNVFLPGYEIKEGALSGAFVLATDAAGSIYLKPQRPLVIAGLRIDQAGESLFQGMDVSLSPRVSYTGESLHVALEKLEIRVDEEMLASADTTITLPLTTTTTPAGTLTADASTKLYLRNLTQLLGSTSTGRADLPATLDLDVEAGVLRQGRSTRLEQLDASLSTSNGDRLVNLALLQPLLIENTGQGSTVVSPAGKLASFNVSDIDLGWFSALIPAGSLKGALRRADFALDVDASGTVNITPERPFSLEGVTLAANDAALLADMGIRISPVISIGRDQVAIGYDGLELASDGSSLASGRGTVRIARNAAGRLTTAGYLNADLEALAQQPVLTRLLGAGFSTPLRLEADYQLATDGGFIDITRLSANLFDDAPQPKITLLADSDIRVSTNLAADAPAAGQARGEVTLTVTDLTARPFADLLAARGLTFTAANGKAVLSSDGSAMRVVTQGPFEVSGIAVGNTDGPMLEPFDLLLNAVVDVQGNTLKATLDPYSVTFAGSGSKPTVQGKAGLELDATGDTLWLSSLTGDVEAVLPPLLRQPALMPGNKLNAGTLNARLIVTPDGRINSTLSIGELAAGARLPLQSISSTMSGDLNRSGDFTLFAPITMSGKSGTGELAVRVARKAPAKGEAGVSVSASGTVVYLNDILNTLNAIEGRQSASAANGNASQREAPVADQDRRDERTPDAQPFWSAPSAGLSVDLDVQKLFYTDYFAVDELTASLQVLPQKLSLEGLRASFRDSPLVLDGTLHFAPGPAPYDLALKASVGQLDLATFFSELAPDAKPRAEGLFDFSFDAYGKSPNMPQFRNELFFNMLAQSQDGVFRLLDPDSAIVASSTTVTGTVGEIVSHVPTGLFGLGAVSRLVRYIKDIEYDRVRIELARGESRDVQIRQYVVQSPEILMTASGGIEYLEDVDILHSPLTLDAQLDMRGKGAAIMYDIDLLGAEQNRWNYWKGPNIRFWGTPAAMQNNLSEVISQAGKGMVIGGLTRPISGLIGNARHRWSDPDKPALKYEGADTPDPSDGQ